MKRKSGTIQESFEVEIHLSDSFICNYTVLAYKQDADYSCMDSDMDYYGYTEINSVNINSLFRYNEETEDYEEIQLEDLTQKLANDIIQKIHDDAVIKINEGLGV